MTAETSWDAFRCAVLDAGLLPKTCLPSHWQIIGGIKHRVVNCWPNTKSGFRFQAEGRVVVSGTVADAIWLAGAPVKPAEPPWGGETETVLQAIRDADPPVGVFRRFWRWLW